MTKPVLSVLINDAIKLEYDRSARLPGKQRDFVAMMEADMDEGIVLSDESIPSPDAHQRGQYVAMNLLYGMEIDDEALVGACCAYLSHYLPGLSRIEARDDGERISMQLHYD